MPEQPLYISNKVPNKINPAVIVPQILNKNRKNKSKQQRAYNSFINMPKEKKISKAQTNKTKNYRTKMCPHGRDCKNRIRCTFAHTEQELRKPFIKRKNPCVLFQRGQCHLGSACRDYHGNIDLKKNYKYKTKVCELFQKGQCLKGQFCIYLHPASLDNPNQKQIEAIIPIQDQGDVSKPKNQMKRQQLDKNSDNQLEINLQKMQKQKQKSQVQDQLEEIPIDDIQICF